MNRSRTIAIALVVTALAGCATAVPAPGEGARTSQAAAPVSACEGMVTSGADAEEIRRLEERGGRANVEGWSIEEARAFFAQEWISVRPDGEDSSLEAVLATFPNGRSTPWAGRFEITDLDIRVYCDVAVAIGRADAYRIGASSQTDSPAVRFRWLNVWRKVDGRWLYAANQFTRY